MRTITTISFRGVRTVTPDGTVFFWPSKRVAEIERMKSMHQFGACNCGSKTCHGHCADAEVWRQEYIGSTSGLVLSRKERRKYHDDQLAH